MSIEKELIARSESKCELCGSPNDLKVYTVPPATHETMNDCVLLCAVCNDQIDNPDKVDTNHWHCLNESMWNTEPAVQVMAWRMLNRLRVQGWAQDMLDMFYLDEETLAWAKSTGEGNDPDDRKIHKDSNGIELHTGDTVVLTKDLNVKGSSMIAKRGTAVRGISLVADNHEQIEGRVNGQMIVILTQFVKKS